MPTLSPDNLNQPIAAHIRPEVTTLNVNWTISEALNSLRSSTLPEKIIYLYVIDDQKKLLGVVPTRRLLMNQPDVKIDAIMVKNVISIPVSMTVLDACEFFVMYRLLAFPVVDNENRLIGAVDVSLFTDEIFDVSARQSNQDVFQLIGIHIAQGRSSSPWAGFKDRFPWLLCNIGGGIACAFIAGLYEKLLDTMIVLALFIPVVLTLAEGVSMQSMTITLQGFREERTHWRAIFRPLKSEFLTATLLAIASGGLVALICYLWKHHALAAIAVGLSIGCAIITACLLGVILPTVVRLLKGDPKIAAGPMVLAAADIATLLFYFTLAGAILR